MKVSNPFAAAGTEKTLRRLVSCRACPRLVGWRERQAELVPPRFREWAARHGFWGRPVPAFGNRGAWLVIVGLAPAAQGANRTGRMFTGDRSGEFLYAALHRSGLASAPHSDHRDDGLELSGVLITAPVRCAPPHNRPTAAEAARCRAYLRADLAGCRSLRVVLALGRLAHDSVLLLLREQGASLPDGIRFGHGAFWRLLEGVFLVDSYHVSQQNTFTGRLTPGMFDTVLARCRALAAGSEEER
ncbi:MAG TPA: uracil-DNA glycosylase [Thermoanaerobaculaceae bacterium]|nr:uracil-DNA glycosylase [Thermoanaerobaculaceae bacterium]